jgi:hypothetical protein
MDGTKRMEGLSMLSAIAFAVGTMIGAGVFVLSGLVIDTAGPGAMLSYIIGGVIIVFSGLSYAALASIFPEDGGGYLYVKRMLGGFVGFIAGWGMYAFMMIASSFVLIDLNLLLGIQLDPRILALAGLVALTLVNLRGISEAGKAEIAMVATKVAILIILVLVGLFHISVSDFKPLVPNGAGSVITGVTMVFFAYTGFQVAAMMAGEVKESSRKVPLAILISIALVMVIYVGVIVALLAAQLGSPTSKLRQRERLRCRRGLPGSAGWYGDCHCRNHLHPVIRKCQYSGVIEDHHGDGERGAASREVRQAEERAAGELDHPWRGHFRDLHTLGFSGLHHRHDQRLHPGHHDAGQHQRCHHGPKEGEDPG